jgi:hypothetical protein
MLASHWASQSEPSDGQSQEPLEQSQGADGHARKRLHVVVHHDGTSALSFSELDVSSPATTFFPEHPNTIGMSIPNKPTRMKPSMAENRPSCP